MIGHIHIYGEIGKQVTLASVQSELDPKASEYIIHIHSNGGDVFEGYAIHNVIKNTGKKVTAYVEGTCASIATLIAAAASNIVMNVKSTFMIHNPIVTNTGGDAKDLRNVAGQLDKIKSQLIDSWVGRTTLSREQLSEMYDNETWLTPEQAVDYGFADQVEEILKAVASADIKYLKHMNNKTSAIDSLKKRIMALFAPSNVADTLADGTVIQVDSEDGDYAGKKVYMEDGTPIPTGEYPLADGRVLVVTDGTISEVREATQDNTETETQDMKYKEENEALKARILELESAIQATKDSEEKAQAKARSFENKLNTEVKTLTAEVNKLRNTSTTDELPNLGDKKQVGGDQAPMTGSLAGFLKQNVIDKRN